MPTVLVVDDNDDMRGLVRDFLQLSDIEVVGEAVDGLDGVDAAARLRPDVVVLDWQMPRMEGIEALPKILAASPGTAVVMFSSTLSDDAERAAVAAGASCFVEKTAALEDLLAAILASAAR